MRLRNPICICLGKWRMRQFELSDEASVVMRRDWDRRADENAFHYIHSKTSQWTEEDFFQTAQEALKEAHLLLPEYVQFKGRILDVGCGVGRMSFEFAETATQVIGVDVSEGMIRKAKGYARKFNIKNAEFYVTDGLGYTMVENSSIDLIYCVRVMQHVPSLSVIQANLRECSRVLTPGGWLIFMTQDNFDPDGKNPTYDGVRCGRREITKAVQNLPLDMVRYGSDGALAYFTVIQKKLEI